MTGGTRPLQPRLPGGTDVDIGTKTGSYLYGIQPASHLGVTIGQGAWYENTMADGKSYREERFAGDWSKYEDITAPLPRSQDMT